MTNEEIDIMAIESKLFQKIQEELYYLMDKEDKEKKLWNRIIEIRNEYLKYLKVLDEVDKIKKDI